ncbi:HAD-IA family hydrolase [Stieleria varia]|uniref:dUMP phosphatase n=1 Tax=Stieleria varia TaxID=2528005 RepID=A0A5C6B6W1_9BACT|nr:HAD-IA family hydrolase [Stieleria varia]TWU07698.1 dUMP phosphatase [Stieleria varia]
MAKPSPSEPSSSRVSRAFSKPPIRCVAFDSTGTIVYPDPHPADVYHAVGTELGSHRSLGEIRVELSAAMRRRFLGDVAMRATDPDYERCRWRWIVSDTLSDLSTEAVDLAFDRLWNHFANPNHWSVFDDVTSALQQLADKGVRRMVASNFDDRLIPVLDGVGLRSLFDDVLVSSRLGWSKPNPDFFHAAAKFADGAAAHEILMIGDTQLNDVDSARTAGWHAELIDRSSGRGLLEIVNDWLE